MKNLKDESFKILGICRTGGVRETTIMKEVIKILDLYKLLDEVVMVIVFQNFDYVKIQGQIVDV